MQQNRLGALRRVQLVFVVRNTADMSWFHSLFRKLEEVRLWLLHLSGPLECTLASRVPR